MCHYACACIQVCGYVRVWMCGCVRNQWESEKLADLPQWRVYCEGWETKTTSQWRLKNRNRWEWELRWWKKVLILERVGESIEKAKLRELAWERGTITKLGYENEVKSNRKNGRLRIKDTLRKERAKQRKKLKWKVSVRKRKRINAKVWNHNMTS